MAVGRTDGSSKVYEHEREGFVDFPATCKTDKQKARHLFRMFDIYPTLDEESGCWIWPLHIAANGYGKWWWNKEVTTAHRWLMQQIVRKNLPRNMHVDHAKWAGCIHRYCVNPMHLEIVTSAENIRRGNWVGKANMRIWDRGAWCDEGHPFNNANTFFVYDRDEGVSFRHCKTCEPLVWKRIQKKRAEKTSRSKSQYGKAA